MRTQIIQLDRFDDVISARDKMTWAKSARILLVWPEGTDFLSRRIDLVLLQRASRQLGAQLGLVARDPLILGNARAAGIPVFKGIDEAERKSWRVGRWKSVSKPSKDNNLQLHANQPKVGQSDKSWQGGKGLRWPAFIIGIAAVIALVIIFYPSAQIVLPPVVKAQSIQMEVRADPGINQINFSGIVPEKTLIVEIEGSDNLRTTGQIMVPDLKATGVIHLTNLTDHAVHIPVGFVVLSASPDRFRFETTRSGIVPAGSAKTLDLPIRALLSGGGSNLLAGQIREGEGLLSLDVSITNPLETSGGTSHLEPGPSPSDRSELKTKLLNTLQKAAENQVRAKLGKGDVWSSQTITVNKIVDEYSFPQDGQPASQFQLYLKVEFQAAYVSSPDLQALAAGVLDSGIPDGLTPRQGSLKIENITRPGENPGEGFRWKIEAKRELESASIGPSAAQWVIGLPPKQAQDRLKLMVGTSGEPMIELSPGWWPWMPFSTLRIAVKG